MFRSTDMRQPDIGRTADHTRAVVTTIRTDSPCQVDDPIAGYTAPAQPCMAMRAEDVFVINATLTLRAHELFLDIMAQVFFFERPFVSLGNSLARSQQGINAQASKRNQQCQ